MWGNLFMSMLTPDFVASIIRITSPILFATLSAVIIEKAGMSNIGIEGTMMISALTGSLIAYYASSWVVGLVAATVMGVVVSLVMGYFSFNLKTDMTLTGIAVNLIGSGGTLFLCKVITGITEGTSMSSTTSLITTKLQVPTIEIPLIDAIPVLGDIVSGLSVLTYLAFLCVPLTWVLLYRTPLGLNLRSIGENPDAASSVGVSAIKMRYIAICLSGLMAGLGGAFMSMSYSMGWSLDMVAGRGFIALAAQAMGGGEPLGSMFAALVFGFAQALGIKFSAVGVDSNLASPIPYIVTIIGLVVFAIRAKRKESKRRLAVGSK